MPLSSNKKISRKAKILPQFSTYSGNKPPLDLLEIQRKSFCDLLERGIIDELSKTNPFRETAKFSGFTQQLELVFNPDTYKLVSPNCTPKEAILKGKTYACKLYVQATLTIRFSPRGSAGSVQEEGETEKQPSVVPLLAEPKVVHSEKNYIHLAETTKNSQSVLKTSLPFKSLGKSLRYLQSLQLAQPTVSWTSSSGSRKRLPIDPPPTLRYTLYDAQDRQPLVTLTDSCTENAKVAIHNAHTPVAPKMHNQRCIVYVQRCKERQQCIQNIALFNSIRKGYIGMHKHLRCKCKEANRIRASKEIQEKNFVDSYAGFARFPLVETPSVWNDVTYKSRFADTKFCDKKENKK